MGRKRGRRRPNGQRKGYQASAYIQPIEIIQLGTRVVLWCRVSSGPQNSNGNTADQEAELRTAVEARGGTVVDVRTYVGRACEAEAQLYDAANAASRAGAVLLAESTSRFARPHRYHPKHRPHRVAGANELRDLRWVCGDVTLVTLHDPDVTWREERSVQTRRGQRQKGKLGGRPPCPKPGYKKERRLRALPKVRWMKMVGMSNRAIARALGNDERNVRRWAAAFLRHDREDERD